MIKSRSFTSVLFALFFAFVSALVIPGAAQAQATIAVSGASATVTRTGHAELLGSMTLTVVSGTTVPGTVEFFVPNIVLANTAASGIAVTGTGGLAASTIATVVPEAGIVLINIPAGAVAGASATLSGVRISAAGKAFTTLDASLSSTGNSIVAGQNLLRVVRAVADGLVVDGAAGTAVTVVGGVIVSGPLTFVVREGWERSFSGTVGVAGQNVKSQLVFRVIGLPDNVSLTFPGVITGDAGATLVTLGGTSQVLSNQSATNRVVYEYNDSASSGTLIDSFTIAPTVDFAGVPSTGTAVIQVTLGPIGAAVPNEMLPSTAIPRFSELFLPSNGGTPIGAATTMVFPVPGSADDQTISIANTGSGGAMVTARARREDGTLTSGTDFTNEITFSLPARQGKTSSLKQLFGNGASSSSVASVEIESQNNGLVGNSIASIAGTRLAASQAPELLSSYLPFDRRTASEIPLLNVQNSGAAEATVTVSLRSSAGAAIATVSRAVASHGALRQSLSSLFTQGTLPVDGYVAVRSTTPVRSVLLNNPALRPDEVPTLVSSASPATFPFFAFGGGYNTTLTLINPSDTQAVRVTLTAYNPNGISISSPLVRTIAQGERQTLDFISIFATVPANQLVAGFFSLNLEATVITSPFQTAPTVVGLTRISTSTLSAAAPLFTESGNRFFLTPTAETATTYTGVAIVNPGSDTASVSVELFSAAGTSLGVVTFSLGGGGGRIQLLRELIPQSLNHENGLVRITSSGGNVKVIGFRGALNLTELIYLRGEVTP